MKNLKTILFLFTLITTSATAHASNQSCNVASPAIPGLNEILEAKGYHLTDQNNATYWMRVANGPGNQQCEAHIDLMKNKGVIAAGLGTCDNTNKLITISLGNGWGADFAPKALRRALRSLEEDLPPCPNHNR